MAAWSPFSATSGAAFVALTLAMTAVLAIPVLDEWAFCDRLDGDRADLARRLSGKRRATAGPTGMIARNVALGSKREELNVSKASRLCPTERPSMRRAATSLMSQLRTCTAAKCDLLTSICDGWNLSRN